MYDRIADLSLTVEDWDLRGFERDTSSGFTRATTVFALEGAGETGRGEDTTYDTDDHELLQAEGISLPTGEFSFEEFSRALADVSLFPKPPDRESFHHYRRWGVESAALDLALRQADTDLASALGRTPDPVRFVASTRLGDPPTTDRVDALTDRVPNLEFKLDPTSEWDDALVADLAARDCVRILDLKGMYEAAGVAQSPDPELYERVVEGFPDALIEDPKLGPETRAVFDGHEDRVSWDVPIESLADVRALPFEPSWLNIKPSRFGTVQSLLETVEYCLKRGIRLYGGGQFELSVGRGQIQSLAGLFYPDGPNDVAPGGYNDPEMPETLPGSPLDPPADRRGFGWTAA
jgi:hypothetical protein